MLKRGLAYCPVASGERIHLGLDAEIGSDAAGGKDFCLKARADFSYIVERREQFAAGRKKQIAQVPGAPAQELFRDHAYRQAVLHDTRAGDDSAV